MRTIILVLVLPLFFFLTGCKKTDNNDNETAPVFKALKNDVVWVSTSNWAYFSKVNKIFSITGSKRDPEYYQEELLSFNFYLSDISKIKSTNHVHSEWLYVIGGDAISDSYQIDTTANNQIQITSLDTIRKKISGTFIIKLIRDPRRLDKGEFFQFTDGKFNLIYKDTD